MIKLKGNHFQQQPIGLLALHTVWGRLLRVNQSNLKGLLRLSLVQKKIIRLKPSQSFWRFKGGFLFFQINKLFLLDLKEHKSTWFGVNLVNLYFLLKERFIVTSHGYKGNNADKHINFWQCTDYTITYKGTQKTQQFKHIFATY